MSDIINDTKFDIEFKERLAHNSLNDIEDYFLILDEIIESNQLKEGDEKLVFSCKRKILNFIIGQRYCLGLSKDKSGKFGAISLLELPNSNLSELFKGNPKAYWNLFNSGTEVFKNTSEIQRAIEIEIIRTKKKSQFRKNNNTSFEKAAFDKTYRAEMLKYAGTNYTPPKIENIPIIKPIPMASEQQQPLNQILFGPPGTGKTYNTINNSLGIIGEEIDGKSRKEIKDLYDAKIKEGQIVFTTFHQSMSYEDFIEGIKPIEPEKEGQPVIYKIVDGIFKKACSIAAYNCYKLFNVSKKQSFKYSFDDLYEAFINEIQELLDKETPPVYKTLRGKDVEVKEINKNDSIIARAKNSVAQSSAPLTKENLQKLYDKFKTIEEIEDLKQVKDTVQITPRITEFYAVFRGLKEFEKTFKPDEELIIERNETEVINFEEIQKKFNAKVYDEAIKIYGDKSEPVILIIDEINRGNVSQIFGELITLIEEDKRLGKAESLEVTLPYSKDRFGVPPNLYIVGTMNTADRSIESLDTALRRRFSFIEMAPQPELIEQKGKSRGKIEGIDLVKLLATINERIEKLIDKDHKIGHSYFLKVSTLDELKLAFKDKILPLLEEYFFGDFGKIGLILGDSFIEKDEPGNFKFANFKGYDSIIEQDLKQKQVYTIKESSVWDFNAI